MAVTIRKLFEAYRRAMETGDIDAMASAYDLPLTVIRPDRTARLRSRCRLLEELQKIIDSYRWAGMARMEMAHFEEVGFMDSLGIVNATWRPRDAEGEVLTEVDTTYVLRQGGPHPVVIAVMAHNEETRRAALLREQPAGGGGENR